MKNSLRRFLPLAVAVSASLHAFAGTETDSKSKDFKQPECPPTPLTLITIDSSYDFDSHFRRGDGRQEVTHNEFEFGQRIPIGFSWPNHECGHWYLRLGVNYDRFDFDTEKETRLVNTLQSASGVIALEYVVRGEVAIEIETQPGVYFEHDINGGAFDAPTDIAAAYEIMHDKVFLVGGVSLSLLRSYPVLPIVGVTWIINDQWRLNAVVPKPRLIYTPADALHLWVGGELIGGGYKTDGRDVTPSKLSGAVVTYTEYRVGAGLTYTMNPLTFEIGGGYVLQREFEYRRARESFITKGGAPYVGLEISAAF